MSRPAIELPDVLPLVMQDIEIMRCLICGAIVPGNWGISRKTMQAGVDHLIDRHTADLLADREPRPPFADCAIQDPFWFEEHA
jgi:hypothetical protein